MFSVVLGLGLLLPPAVRAQDRVVAAVDSATQLSAYGSALLWSSRDPASGRFHLMYTDAARPPAPLPVADRAVPFDADLGPAGDGRIFAVYTRCSTEPAYSPLSVVQLPDYATGRRCRIHQLDISSGQETVLAATAARHGSEFLPSYWKGRVAFGRVYDGRRSYPYLYERKASGGRTRRMPGGPRRRCALMPSGKRFCGRSTLSRPTGIDLHGRRLAFTWSYDSTYEAPASDVRLDDTRRATGRRVDRNRGGGLTTIERAAPSFAGSQLYFARLCIGDESGCPHRSGLVRYRHSTGTFATAPIGNHDVWQARGGDITYVLRDTVSTGDRRPFAMPTVATCQILATTPDYR